MNINKYWLKLHLKLKNIVNKIINKPLKLDITKFNYNYNSNDGKYIKSLLDDSIFIGKSIKEFIKNNYNQYYLIKFDNNIIYYFMNKDDKEYKIKREVENICNIIYSIKKLFKKENSKQKLYYFPTPLKKSFNNKTKILGVTECNTGFSYLYNLGKSVECSHDNGDIFIFRREEVYKVLIHELIHASYRDQELILNNNNKLNNHICIKNKVLLNEAYTETLATLLNILYINCWKNGSEENLKMMFNDEMKFSFYMMNKILVFNKVNKINDIIKKERCDTVIQQNTNLFSYYIAKPLLLSHNDIFAKYMGKYTNKLAVNGFNEGESSSKLADMILTILNKIKDYKPLLIKNDNKSLRLTLNDLEKISI